MTLPLAMVRPVEIMVYVASGLPAPLLSVAHNAVQIPFAEMVKLYMRSEVDEHWQLVPIRTYVLFAVLLFMKV
jgi:hypothetical protein